MPENESRSRAVKLVVLLVIVLLLVIFWAQNRNQTTIKFLFFDGEVRVWVALLFASVAGFIIGWLVRGGRD